MHILYAYTLASIVCILAKPAAGDYYKHVVQLGTHSEAYRKRKSSTSSWHELGYLVHLLDRPYFSSF